MWRRVSTDAQKKRKNKACKRAWCWCVCVIYVARSCRLHLHIYCKELASNMAGVMARSCPSVQSQIVLYHICRHLGSVLSRARRAAHTGVHSLVAMPGSIAASGCSTPQGKKVGSRQQRTMVKALAAGLSTNKEYTKQSELNYITTRLQDEDADLVTDLATLLRNGTLRKAVDAIKGSESASNLGRELPPSQTTFRLLRDATLQELLQAFEGEKRFTDEILGNISREEKCQLVTFALGVGPRESLPALSSALRYTKVLASYCKLRYIDLGRRLSKIDPTKVSGFGYYSIDGKEIKLNVAGEDAKKNKSVTFELLDSRDDWILEGNHSVSATLVIKGLCVRANLRELFEKSGAAAPPQETLEWSIRMERWPREMTAAGVGASSSAAAPSPLQPKASRGKAPDDAENKAKRPKRGSGRAVVTST